jgi:cytochrome P450
MPHRTRGSEQPERKDIREIDDLPYFLDAVQGDWHKDLMDTARNLMEKPWLGLLRSSPEAIVAFRYQDVMNLTVEREAGNLPIDLIAARSKDRTTNGATTTPGDQNPRRPFFTMLADQAFTHNPPLHKFTRRMLSRQLLRHNMLRMLPMAGEIINSLVASLRDRGEVDFAADFARPYVSQFWGAALGLTAEESTEVEFLMRDLNLIFQVQRNLEDSELVDRAAERYVEVVSRRVDDALAGQDNQLIKEMAADLAEINAEGRPGSLGSYVAANFFDGFHTVAVAVSNVLYVLLSSGRYEELLTRPDLIPMAVRESLRLAPPLLLTHRYALADIDHNGLKIPSGTSIGMLWGSAGFDPEVFDEPEAFRWDRPKLPLFMFGGGAHLCPGRTAAHLLVERSLQAFVEHGVRWRLTDGHSYRWRSFSTMRELEEFPVEIESAAELSR